MVRIGCVIGNVKDRDVCVFWPVDASYRDHILTYFVYVVAKKGEEYKNYEKSFIF